MYQGLLRAMRLKTQKFWRWQPSAHFLLRYFAFGKLFALRTLRNDWKFYLFKQKPQRITKLFNSSKSNYIQQSKLVWLPNRCSARFALFTKSIDTISWKQKNCYSPTLRREPCQATCLQKYKFSRCQHTKKYRLCYESSFLDWRLSWLNSPNAGLCNWKFSWRKIVTKLIYFHKKDCQ